MNETLIPEFRVSETHLKAETNSAQFLGGTLLPDASI
jgi:hypothetical protein